MHKLFLKSQKAIHNTLERPLKVAGRGSGSRVQNIALAFSILHSGFVFVGGA